MSARVVIADNHALFRQSLRSFLLAQSGIDVVAEADSAEAFVRAVTVHNASLAILDVHLQGGGLASVAQVSAPPCLCSCIVVSVDASASSVRRAIAVGATGYLLKESLETELAPAIALVTSGGLAFSAGVRDALQNTAQNCPVRLFPELTNRESDVLAELAMGRTNVEIAATLFLSPKTVANHISIILEKLHEPDRASLVRRARSNGFE